jgi:hypothetical protein
VAYSLDIVAGLIEEEGTIVVGVVVRTDTRGTVVLGTSLDGSSVECVDSGTI